MKNASSKGGAELKYRAFLKRLFYGEELLNFRNMAGKTRFIACRRILMDQTFIDGLVDQRNRRTQRFGAQFLIVVSDGAAQSLDLGPQLPAVTAIDRISFSRLSDSFFCRFMICHEL